MVLPIKSVLISVSLAVLPGVTYAANLDPDAPQAAQRQLSGSLTVGAGDNSGNIFTPPATERSQIPVYSQSMQGKMRQAFLGTGKEGVPGFNQIKQIPSLTPGQRRELHKIFAAGKQEIQPLLEQAKELREKVGDNQSQSLSNPEMRQQLRSLHDKIVAKRADMWQRLKVHLTPDQLDQLQAMRRGELMPSTFRSPADGGELMPINKE